MNEKLSNKILDKLKEREVKPKARWSFLLKNYVVWALGGLSLIVGAAAFSVLFHMIRNNDWAVHAYVSNSFVGFMLKTLPYFWIILFVVFLLAADYNIRHTQKGYRYSLYKIVIGSVLVSAVLGLVFYDAGFGQAIDTGFANKVPGYKRVINRQEDIWQMPNKGLLGGEIINGQNTDKLRIRDFNQKEWDVISQDAHIPPMLEFKEGERIKAIGEPVDEDTFRADKIAPWQQQRKPLQRLKGVHNNILGR